MNILVTGGAGFIGSHLIERLLNKKKHKIICLDDFDTYYDPAVKRRNIEQAMVDRNFDLIEGDIRNSESLMKCFESTSVDVVVHLAARAGVRPSIANPDLYYDVNVMGTLRLLEAMRKANVKRLVFASSSSVYGNNPHVPFSETDNVDDPISPYAASKKAGELICHTYHHLYGFNLFCLRFFTVFGPRQRPDMAIQQFIRKMLDHQAITLYGDGSSRRDYTYVADIVQGVEQSIERVKGYEVINVGESRTTSLIDLITLIEAQLGMKADIQWRPMQPGDVLTTFANIEKAKSLLGYLPQFSMQEGIRLACEWNKSVHAQQ